jgi:phosphotransferase system HPr-like phosphotransfer protein
MKACSIEYPLTMHKGFTLEQTISFIHRANQFQSTIYLMKKNMKVNGKNILGLSSMMVTIQNHCTLILSIDGLDAENAFSCLIKLIHSFKVNTA